ncbi:hypothetical protein SAG0141_10620 [Streptococcus agalactiae MRI Z1-023]|nr:Hypothetical Protein GBS85147_0246 [Streptococcus agalactiae]EPW75480.1 hypothetical protein SAG0101_10270 [Streptococcus agalactiae BSU451]EPW95364.1 hypothetical protein SAG0141_10620 [Streptococcus agalactiae MRI Z1-023]
MKNKIRTILNMINDNNNWFYKVIKNVFRRWFLSYGLKVFLES